jgi:hypothetical protein
LEAKLEIISPEDLTVCCSAAVVLCVLVTSESEIELCIIIVRNWRSFPLVQYDDLVADVVSNDNSMQLKLADLEAKLEIISPEDLTVCWSASVVICIFVTSESELELCIIIVRHCRSSPLAQYDDCVSSDILTQLTWR